MFVSEIKTTPPEKYETELQKKVYETLAKLDIPFERVDNDPTVTMEDCIKIDERLQMKTSKTLLLCNRQKTNFYLFVMSGDKHFSTKDFSHALGIARVSFANEQQLLEMVGTKIGASTVFGTLNDPDNRLRIVFDSEVLEDEWFGCTDTTQSVYMKLKTEDVVKKLLPYTHHAMTVIKV